jgi:subtilisin family serine protease
MRKIGLTTNTPMLGMRRLEPLSSRKRGSLMRTKWIAAALVALPAWASPSLQAQEMKRVIITFNAGTSDAAKANAIAAVGGTQLSEIKSNGTTDKEFVAVVAQVPRNAEPVAIKKAVKGVMALDASPSDQVGVEEDYKIKWIEAANSPSFQETSFGRVFNAGALKFNKTAASAQTSQIMAMGNRSKIPWGVAYVRAPAAWDYTKGAGVGVAVIDTGIDSSHPNLEGAVDNLGYGAADDCEMPSCYQDDQGHGTHVAGTIAGRGVGQWGVFGVAPAARLYAVKVLGADGSGTLSDVIKGIIWVANHNEDIQVANMSLGSDSDSPTMHRAVRYAKARGIVIVAAAGNSGPPKAKSEAPKFAKADGDEEPEQQDDSSVGYPGRYEEVIAVAALDWNYKTASFSSQGKEVDFTAPGVAVLSTKKGGDYHTLSGTSMATPHMAGLAALTVSQGYRGLDGPDGVFSQLKKAAKKLPGLSDKEQGAGMVDAAKLTRNDRAAMVAVLQ